jgi:hypothetical protein
LGSWNWASTESIYRKKRPVPGSPSRHCPAWAAIVLGVDVSACRRQGSLRWGRAGGDNRFLPMCSHLLLIGGATHCSSVFMNQVNHEYFLRSGFRLLYMVA